MRKKAFAALKKVSTLDLFFLCMEIFFFGLLLRGIFFQLVGKV
jgi:hypothetical protein